MKPDTIHIYTDASFSKFHNIAVIGHAIFRSNREHEAISISDMKVTILEIRETNNIRAEIKGAIAALQTCPEASEIVIYSDCQTTCRLPERREKLERTNYISQSKNLPLNNADLYQEFYAIYDRLKPQLIWVQGHSSDLTNRIQRNFSYLDKEVRRNLREAIRKLDRLSSL